QQATGNGRVRPHPRLFLLPASCCLLPHSGTFASSSSSHTRAVLSEGARQSPRGDSEPPVTTFGPFGRAERLNCEVWKKRTRNFRSQCLMVGRSYSILSSSGVPAGQSPRAASFHA